MIGGFRSTLSVSLFCLKPVVAVIMINDSITRQSLLEGEVQILYVIERCIKVQVEEYRDQLTVQKQNKPKLFLFCKREIQSQKQKLLTWCNCCCFKFVPQLPALRPKKLMHISKPQKTVSRAYGGSQCGRCVRER